MYIYLLKHVNKYSLSSIRRPAGILVFLFTLPTTNLPAKKKPRFRNAETNFAPGRMFRELRAGNFADRVQKRERQTS